MVKSFDIRPAVAADAPAIADVQVASWNTTYRGLLPDALIDRITVPDRTQQWTRIINTLDENGTGKVFVCEAEGKVVGFASVGAQREPNLKEQGYDAELTSAYLYQENQRQGIGNALVSACFAEGARLGYKGITAWVLSTNAPARAFYEKFGGEIVEERESDDRHEGVSETAYGWSDLAATVAKSVS